MPTNRLPNKRKTEPFKKASRKTSDQENSVSPSSRALFWERVNNRAKIKPTIIAGDSIRAKAATMCPLYSIGEFCCSKNELAVTKVTALIEP